MLKNNETLALKYCYLIFVGNLIMSFDNNNQEENYDAGAKEFAIVYTILSLAFIAVMLLLIF